MMEDYLSDTVTLQSRTGAYDAYGQPALAPTVSLPARVDLNQRMMRGKNGELAMADARVWLPAGTAIEPGDKLTVAGQPTYQVARVQRRTSLGDETHVVALLVK